MLNTNKILSAGAAALVKASQFDLENSQLICSTSERATNLAEILTRLGYKAEVVRERGFNSDKINLGVRPSAFHTDFAPYIKYTAQSKEYINKMGTEKDRSSNYEYDTVQIIKETKAALKEEEFTFGGR